MDKKERDEILRLIEETKAEIKRRAERDCKTSAESIAWKYKYMDAPNE